MKKISCDKMEELKGMFANLQYTLTFIFVGPLCFLLLIYIFFFTNIWYLSIVYLIYYLIDRTSCERGGKQSKEIQNWRIWKWMAGYFPIKLIFVDKLLINDNSNYLLGYHPHGVTNIGGFCTFAVNGTGIQEKLPNFKTYLTVLKGHFDFPIYRDYVMKSGLVAVTKQSIKYLLEGPRRRGNLVALIIGGAHEALDAHPGKNKVHIHHKIGFFKIALQTGTSIIPCYSFGENNCYKQVDNKSGSFFRKFQDCLTRIFGFSPPIFYGRGVFPFRNPITTIIGKPIEVIKVEKPSEEEIINLRNLYIDKLKELFYEYKPLYAAKEEDLEII